MTLVHFWTSESASQTADVVVGNRVWTYPALTKSFGSCTIRVPRDNPIIQTDAINEQRGTFVRIDHPFLPPWRGIQEGRMRQSAGWWEMECSEIGILYQFNDVGVWPQRVRVEAGLIAQRAYQSISGNVAQYIRPGTFAIGPPLISDYSPAGLVYAKVLSDLSEMTGQEWQITEGPNGGVVLNWGTMHQSFYEPILFEGPELELIDRVPDSSTLVRRVRARGPANPDTGFHKWEDAVANDLNNDPLAQSIVIDTPYTTSIQLYRAAEQRLELGRYENIRYTFGLPGQWTRSSSVTVTNQGMGSSGGSTNVPLRGGGVQLRGGGVPLMSGGGSIAGPGQGTITTPVFTAPAWAGIRPGGTIRAVVPSAGKSGQTIVGRVLQMSYGEGAARPYLVIEVQELRPPSEAALAASRYRINNPLTRTPSPAQTISTVRMNLRLPTRAGF